MKRLAMTLVFGLTLPGASPAADGAPPVLVRVQTKDGARRWSEHETTRLSHLAGFRPAPVALTRYGGRMDRKEEATGFFYTKKTAAGWILVDPDGGPFFSIGVCSTSPHDAVADHRKAFAERFTDRADWARKTHALLVDDMKFNSLGCWSDATTFKTAGRETPYVRIWYLMASYGEKKGITYAKYGHAGFRDDVLPVFDEAFAAHCEEVCRRMGETRDDPWLLGHFSDNELPLRSGDMLKRYLRCPVGDASRIAAERFLRRKGVASDAIRPEHDVEFAALVLRTYYQTVHDAIRRHDPNHLVLGSRLHGRAANQDISYTASGPFVDVVSINYYNRWTPDQAELDRRAELAGKPLLISEFYAKGADSRLDTTKGAGHVVPTQGDRGAFYEHFALGLLRNRNVVGWHWFRYIDDGDRKTRGFSSNKGIVDLRYRPYRELAESMRAVNAVAYPLADFLRGAPAAVAPETEPSSRGARGDSDP